MKDIKFNYENKCNRSFLIYELSKDEKIDKFEQNMMSNNKLEGLLEFSYSNIDDKHCFKYDVTSKINVKMYLDKCKDEDKVIKIFINIFMLLLELEDFMIVKEHLFLNVDYVFIDVSSLQVYFICLPIEDIPNENTLEISNFKQFINSILSKLILERFENKVLINKLIEFLNKDEFTNVEETIKFLKNLHFDKKSKVIEILNSFDNIENDKVKEDDEIKSNFEERKIKKISYDNYSFLVPGQEKKLEKGIEKKEAEKRKSIKEFFSFSSFGDKKRNTNKDNNSYENIQSQNNIVHDCNDDMSYNKTVIIKSSDDNQKTVLLNALNSGLYQNIPYLIRRKNNERINITSSMFRIGKEKEYVDYAILDNETISRAHADIIKINNEYFLQDNNSKNSSYINEVKLSDGQAVRLEHNSEIRLSDEVFTFKLY